jgi:hypothetical protein
MDAAYVSALSALAGSVIGGLSSGLTTLVNQRAQSQAEQAAHDVVRREDLVRDFIVTAAETYGDAIVNSNPKIQDLVNLYAMVSRMRVLSMPQSVTRAETLMSAIVETYHQPNRTLSDLRDLMKPTGAKGIDILREFSETARTELRA